ncbi:MAG: A24 family peptidase [Lachnospiraceae bacterium]|nr:A24 family peptidase [Lachnospiraceae bacterium]MDE7183056.1 A24 family peptidase [Lachnospiraceae bacterium]
MGILIGVFSAAVFMDWRFYRIPNVCIAAGMAHGMILTYMSFSWTGVVRVLGVMAVLFMVFYPFYLLGALGAGDVKLFMMMGCFHPLMEKDGLLHYMLVTMALAAIRSVMKMAVYPECRERLFYLARYVRKAVLTGTVDSYEIDKTQTRCVVRLSIPAFLSLLLMSAGVYV